MKYMIKSTKTPKEMEELLTRYNIKELGNTWLTNGTVYQSFIGEEIPVKEIIKEKKDVKATPKAKRSKKVSKVSQQANSKNSPSDNSGRSTGATGDKPDVEADSALRKSPDLPSS